MCKLPYNPWHEKKKDSPHPLSIMIFKNANKKKTLYVCIDKLYNTIVNIQKSIKSNENSLSYQSLKFLTISRLFLSTEDFHTS